MFVPRVDRRDSVNRADTGARDSGVLLQTVASIEDRVQPCKDPWRGH
jgi:hypothetical protein